MRFAELALDSYGAVKARTIAFPHPGLTVVYGPNEAGKSTSLAAVGDFLFGVPTQTSRGSVFGYDAMRIGARLVRADGSELALRRRKGRAGRTLTDWDGAPADEGLLAALLGATTRERFENLFGLDHARLRDGGERMLTADGEIGRLIVEAGGGLRSLVARLEAIDRTLDGLFAPRRSGERAFYKALTAFEEADRDAKAGLLTKEAYDRARAALTDAETETARLREARRALARERSGLERIARVSPLLQWLELLSERLAADPDLARLPDGFAHEARAALTACAEAEKALAESDAVAETLGQRLAAIAVDDALVAAEAAIRDVVEDFVHVAKAREDRPNRQRELAQAEANLARLRRMIGAREDEDLMLRLPPPEAVEAVRRLATAAAARAPRRAALDAQVSDGVLALRRLDARIAAARDAGRHKPSGVASSELAGLPSLAAEADARVARARTAAADVAARAAALGFPTAAAVRDLPCPSAESAGRLLAAAEARAERRSRHAEAGVAAQAKRAAALAAIIRLQAGGEIATDAALGAARAARETAWAQVRAAHRAGAADPDSAVRAAEVETVDRALAQADELADRRAREAQRAAALAQAEAQRDDAAAEIAAAEASLAAIDRETAAAAADLASAFPEVARRAPSPAALKALADARDALLAAATAAETAQADAEVARRALEGPLAALAFAERGCGLAPAEGSAVAERARRALAGVAAHDEAHAEHRRDLKAREDADAATERARTGLAALDREEASWAEAWGPALARLALPASTSPEDAASAAHEWAGARGVLDALGQVRRRVFRMDEDEADLKARVETIGRAAGLALPEDAVAAARMLQARFIENDAARARRETLAPDAEEAARTAAARRLALAEREAAAARLCEIAGLLDDDWTGLAALAERHAGRLALKDEIARAEDGLATAGDGLPLDALKAAAAERDPDALAGDLAALEDRERQLDADVEAASLAEHAARAAVAGHHEAAGVNRAVVARESATAELHDVVERYVELSLARDLVEGAIAKVRAERQDPLVARAAALFQCATRGAYAGLGAEVDASGAPAVVGLRGDGSSVEVRAMSDGARDQLYLAFRLASLEAYARETEPLPFVADDVLVHFDDARSRATLDLLADFGATAQTLLFTHHDSVRAMAETLAADGRCGVVTLE
ncbi:uncharacterized protein YhaN [Methylopila capsulata]|uniref:Uncharacterized protein YhaN n=1 Tax=Methylopila capsulata TaxID=61654 RepID=A0A9W6IVM2_9HYPH|nr:AAA family ATPase [Methylopila capsulata]MBM7850701.1 uncharacterized protein YhaN [Methylopila capsulata]GLK55995.1 hypothetical protein GCM10008170_20140 [Methylopila capsulata]